ncbi:hypothetical protein BYT27DRAFT_7340210 [Phlegmacium glaucopus]|nr:hypothetical protein BYT27DRAFT_7340210 [Phlegmacium glaucopus]
MSVQIFPPEILDLFLNELASATTNPQSRAALLACTLVNRQFYYQASSYIFSSLTIYTQNRLNALLDILNVNPDIARHIRSFTVKHQPSSERLSAVFRQLRHLQEFRWIGRPTFFYIHAMLIAITLSVSSLCSDLPYLTVLHLENMKDFPLSLFSSCCHLESLTLFRVLFAKIQPETLSRSLFPSLRRLSISGPLSNDDEAVGTIMTHAAPTLTTLILCDPLDNNFGYFKSTVVLQALESIQISCMIFLYDANPVPTFLSQFLDHSTPMLTQIQIKCICNDKHSRIHHPLFKGFLPIDEILSSPKYQALKTLDLIFVDIYSPQLRPDSLEVRTLLNEILPAVSSRSQTEIKITAGSPRPLYSCVEVHFVF